MFILGIETSCDETSIALLEKQKVVANKIYTQDIHAKYGGVVPEMASRAHLQKIDRLCYSLCAEHHINPPDIKLIAVTDSPGLAGALLVGISFALGMHCGYNIPITGINHLDGHIASVTIENPGLGFPFLALVVSGGHTAIYKVEDFTDTVCLGHTIDDAAGEAFDKIGKMLGFPYPAGREIEKKASMHASDDYIPFPVARVSTNTLDFSFSGLKTAVKYHIQEHDTAYITQNLPLLCYSFQRAVIESLTRNISVAVEQSGIKRVALVGGVACNTMLRNALKLKFRENCYFPSAHLCTDNAAMIAKAGYEKYVRGKTRFPRMLPTGSVS
jgi:N6-L-threonylcarbamoyladenine synthase